MLDARVWERLRGGRAQFAEVAASRAGRRAWVGVYPFKHRGPEEYWELVGRYGDYGSVPWRYRVRRFEVEEVYIDGGYDVHEEELLDGRSVVVGSEEELERVLREWVGESGRWDDSAPGYPI
jgi:hypothetical protein